ncbi:MAG TPA: hypothetical protein PLF78_10125, partial [Caulobacter sp.]|nr:hypothetical protein [Caulobacter sp.]
WALVVAHHHDAENRRAGFPRPDVHGIYLFRDGVEDDAVTLATDLSGLGNDATLFPGSAVYKSAYGVDCPLGYGFMFDTGLPYGGAMSGVMCARVLTPYGTSLALPWLWGSTVMPNTGNITASQDQDPNGTLYVNIPATEPSPNSMALSFLYQGASGVGVNTIQTLGYDRRGWIVFANQARRNAMSRAIAWSYDPATNTFIHKLGSQEGTVTGAAMATEMEGMGGNHMFGIAHNSNVQNAQGDVLGAAFYSAARDFDGLDVLITAMVREAENRGVTPQG